MKLSWTMAALLSSALLVGCGSREAENSPNPQGSEDTSVAIAPDGTDEFVEAPAAEDQRDLSSNRDSSAFTGGSQATTGNRARTAPAPAPAPRRDPPAPAPVERVAPEPPRAAAPAPPPPVARVITIPAGTALPLELTTAVSTETARVEMPVTARLRRSVTVDGIAVLPAGAVVHGEVIDVDRPGRVQGRARLGLRFTSVTIDGQREAIRTNPVMFEGEATKGEDATKIGAGAGVGAVIGGILGGGDGAAKGAAIGGAAGTGAVLATRGREIELAAGHDITATLASAVDVVR